MKTPFGLETAIVGVIEGKNYFYYTRGHGLPQIKDLNNHLRCSSAKNSPPLHRQVQIFRKEELREAMCDVIEERNCLYYIVKCRYRAKAGLTKAFAM